MASPRAPSKRVAVVVAVLVAGGCGGIVEEGAERTPAIDAGQTSTGGGVLDASAPDAHVGVRVLSVTPADGALHVGKFTSVVVQLSGAVDPPSIDRTVPYQPGK
jgi:hypothetical protein